MNPFGRSKKAAPDTPLILGETRPGDNLKAREAFARLIGLGRMSRCGSGDGMIELELGSAVNIATLYCNGSLMGRLDAFAAALRGFRAQTVGQDELDRAEEHFVQGCRIALGEKN